MPEYLVTDQVDPTRNAIVVADNKAQALRLVEQDRLSAALISGPALIDAIQRGLPVLRQIKAERTEPSTPLDHSGDINPPSTQE